jgi:hypothetical protein
MAKKTGLTLTQTRIAAGWWEGVLIGAEADTAVGAWHQDRRIEGVEVTKLTGKSGQAVRVPLVGSVLSEGVQTVLLKVGEEVLAHFTIVAGVPLEEDLRAEIGLLRAELDLLKRAFRRHCAETAG